MSSKSLAQRIIESTTAFDAYSKLESFLRAIISEGIDIDNPEDWVNKIGVERKEFINHMLGLSNGIKQKPAIVYGKYITSAALKFLEEIDVEVPEYVRKLGGALLDREQEKPVRVDTGSTAGARTAFNFVSLSGEPLSKQPKNPVVVEVPIFLASQGMEPVGQPGQRGPRGTNTFMGRAHYGMPDEYTEKVKKIREAFSERSVVLVFKRTSGGTTVGRLEQEGLSPKDIGQRLLAGQLGADGVRVIDPAKSDARPIPIIDDNAAPEEYIDKVPVSLRMQGGLTTITRWDTGFGHMGSGYRTGDLKAEFDTSLAVWEDKPAGIALARFGCFGVVVRPKTLG